MKRIICCLLMVIYVVAIATGSSASEMFAKNREQIRLSEMTDDECVAFLKNAGIDLPYDAEDTTFWGPVIREMILAVEGNPAYPFGFSFTKMQELANAVKAAVNNYYGVNAELQRQIMPRSLNYEPQYSIFEGIWTDDFKVYNCYGYAMNEPHSYVNPGFFSGQELSVVTGIGVIADLVEADLQATGHNDVVVEVYSADTVICASAEVIALRIRPRLDYHFMRLDKASGSWYHKPGETAMLRYLGDPLTGVWNNERYYVNEYLAPSIEYNSAIYLFMFDFDHDYEYEYCGGGRHILTCTSCGVTTGSAVGCVMNGNVCVACDFNSSGGILSTDENSSTE